MFASELYDLIKEQITDPFFDGFDPGWHYWRTKMLIHSHLCEQIQATMWVMK